MDVCVGGRHSSPFPWAASEPGESFIPGDQLVDEQAQSLGASRRVTWLVCVFPANAGC